MYTHLNQALNTSRRSDFSVPGSGTHSDFSSSLVFYHTGTQRIQAVRLHRSICDDLARWVTANGHRCIVLTCRSLEEEVKAAAGHHARSAHQVGPGLHVRVGEVGAERPSGDERVRRTHKLLVVVGLGLGLGLGLGFGLGLG